MRLFLLFIFIGSLPCQSQNFYQELYRPQIHFSPKENWMNDPNGLVLYDGTYHLFFQYYPDGTVWGPMHWGHAVSRDLMHWKQLPIALYPDSLGYIFSGSAVVDSNNTSGFGKHGQIPLVSIFTQHDPKGEKEETNQFQNQSIAFSLDKGITWIKYPGNPVLKTPRLKDFRDPKVSWYPEQRKWIMTLAAGDRIMFFSSPDLKSWTKESDFGQGLGAHGGVWECPDLLHFFVQRKKIWLLIVNINPGGIQGGSGTQYFTGNFDGKKFTCTDTVTKWADYGADDYAGVTWSNTGDKKIFLGWMSNWQYATKVPTKRWRSAMTIPRLLTLKNIKGRYFTAMTPVPSLETLTRKTISYAKITLEKKFSISGPTRIDFKTPLLQSFTIRLSNPQEQELSIGYDLEKNSFYIDRTHAGRSDFDPGFAAVHYGPRIADTKNASFTLILDNASIELFADEGLTTMTEIFFPDTPFDAMQLKPAKGAVFQELTIRALEPVWAKNQK
jgi:fructan beta-fructosidase